MSTTTVEKTKKSEAGKDKKSELLLDSLEIKGYRCFEHLTIEKLGRVNLIVGKNSVGKTALLEALWFYSRRGFSDFLLDNLRSRKEMPRGVGSTDDPNEINERLQLLKHLFYGRPEINDNTASMKIGSLLKSKSNLSISLEWHSKDFPENRDDRDIGKTKSYSKNGQALFFIRKVLGGTYFSNPINSFMELFWNYEKMSESDLLKCQFVQTNELKSNSDDKLWDNIVLTPLEDKLVESLKIIHHDIERVAFTGESRGFDGRMAFATFANSNERFSLNSLGEGMNRLLRISLALVNSQNGILLIDEIESGLHYSVLPEVWKLIFKTARDLNVQVFATTHSKDCLEAFTQAAIEDKESDGMLIRLENKNGSIKAVNFNEDELETVERRNIEVR